MSWFRSLKGGLLLSFLALLSLLVRSYADTRFILVEDFADLGMSFVVIWILGYTAIIGGWIWSLVIAAQGNRAALYILLGYALVCAIWFGAVSLVINANFAVEVVLFSSSFITGAVAAISIILHLRSGLSAKSV